MDEQLKGEEVEVLEEPQGIPEYIVHQGTEMLAKNEDPERVESLFMEHGLSADDARTFTDQLGEEIRAVKKTAGNKDMLYGALWCIGGTVGTLADIGFIFWGAILFGAIQFIKGAITAS